jgi:hypothetical protein
MVVFKNTGLFVVLILVKGREVVLGSGRHGDLSGLRLLALAALLGHQD